LPKDEPEDTSDQKLNYLSIARFLLPAGPHFHAGIGRPATGDFLSRTQPDGAGVSGSLSCSELAGVPVPGHGSFLSGSGSSHCWVNRMRITFHCGNLPRYWGISVNHKLCHDRLYPTVSEVWYLQVFRFCHLKWSHLPSWPTRILAILPGSLSCWRFRDLYW